METLRQRAVTASAETLPGEGLSVVDLRTPVHRAINLELPARGLVGIHGPSGAGKSSLLAALAGLLPARGEIAWRGEVWQKGRYSRPLHRRPLSLGFQGARVFPGLSVAQNLRLAERYARRPLPEEHRRMLLDALALGPLLERHTDKLSGGELQRVALMRQLLSNAPVQFFDEPLSAVDSPLRLRKILPALKKTWRDHPALVLWVSHDLAEMQLLADRYIEVRDGVVSAQNSPAPREGDENRLEETAQCHLDLRVRETLAQDQLLVLALGRHLLYADRYLNDYRAGEVVRVMLAAADISLSLKRPSASSVLNCLPVVLRNLRPLGDGRMRLLLDCEGQPLRAEISKFSCKKLQLQPGQSLYAQFKAGSLQGL